MYKLSYSDGGCEPRAPVPNSLPQGKSRMSPQGKSRMSTINKQMDLGLDCITLSSSCFIYCLHSRHDVTPELRMPPIKKHEKKIQEPNLLKPNLS